MAQSRLDSILQQIAEDRIRKEEEQRQKREDKWISDILTRSGVDPTNATEEQVKNVIEQGQQYNQTLQLQKDLSRTASANDTLQVQNAVNEQQRKQERLPSIPERDRDSAIGYSIDQAQSLLGAGIQTIGDLTGVDFLRDYGADVVAEQQKDIEEGGYVSKYSKGFFDTLSEDGIFSSVGWLSEKIQENLVVGALALGGSAAAAASAPVSGALAFAIGGATTLGTAGIGIGSVRQELEEKGIYDPNDSASVVGAGIAIGLLDRIAGAGKVLNKSGALKGLFETGAVKQMGLKAIEEAGTEVIQEAMTVGTAALHGAEYSQSELLNRFIDAGVIGGAFGGTFGAGLSAAKSADTGIRSVQSSLEAKRVGIVSGAETVASPDVAANESVPLSSKDPTETLNDNSLGNTTPDSASQQSGAVNQQSGGKQPTEGEITSEESPAPSRDNRFEFTDKDSNEIVDEIKSESTLIAYRTEDGSVYSAESDGTTKKKNTADAKKPAETSSKTIYIDPSDIPEGDIALLQKDPSSVISIDPKSQTVEAGRYDSEAESTITEFTGLRYYDEPAIGRIPVELSGKTSDANFGVEEAQAYSSQIVGSAIKEMIAPEVKANQEVRSEIEDLSSSDMVYGKKKGYSSEANAKQFGVSKAGGKPTKIVRRGSRYFVVGLEESSPPVSDKVIPEFVSKVENPEETVEGSSSAFSDFTNIRASRRRVGDLLETAVDRTQSFLQKAGLAQRTMSSHGNELVNKLSVLNQDPKANSAEIEKVEQELLKIRAGTESQAWKKLRYYMKYRVGRGFDDDISTAAEDRFTTLNRADTEARNLLRIYRENVETDVAGKSEKEAQQLRNAYDSLLQKIIIDDESGYRLKLVDGSTEITPETIARDKDGKVIYFIGGVEHTAPAGFSDTLAEFSRLNSRERKYLLEEYLPSIESQVQQEIDERRERLDNYSDSVGVLLDSSGGYENLGFAAFEAKTWEGWMSRLLGDPNDPVTGSVLLDGLVDFIDSKTGGKGSSEHFNSFVNALQNSNDIAEFHANTNNFFLKENGDMPVAVAAALGAFEGNSALHSAYTALRLESASIQKLQATLNHTSKIRSNPFHVSRSYIASEGDSAKWVKARRNPTTDEDRRINVAFKDYLRGKIAEKTGLSTENSMLDRFVEAEYNSIVDSYDIAKIAEGGPAKHLTGVEGGTRYGGIFLKRQELSQEYRDFLGEIKDPAEKISYSIRRLQRFNIENRFYNTILRSDFGKSIFSTEQEALAAGIANPTRVRSVNPNSNNKVEGMWASEESAYVLEQLDSAGIYELGIGNVLQQVSGATKVSFTLLSPFNAAANIIGGLGLITEHIPLLSGNPSIMVERIKRELSQMTGKAAREAEDAASKWLEGGSARAQDINANIELSNDLIGKIFRAVEDKIPSGASIPGAKINVSSPYSSFVHGLMQLQRLSDELPQKVIFDAWYNEAKSYFKMSDPEAENFAKDFSRRTGIFTARNPKAVQDLQRLNVIGGGFMGWATGMQLAIRERAVNVAILHKMSVNKFGRENIPNFNPNDKTQFQQASRAFYGSKEYLSSPVTKALFGLAVGVATPSVYALGIAAAVGGLGSLVGGDDEELALFDSELHNAIGHLSPSYYQNIDKQIVNVRDGGQSIEYINVSRLGNFGLFSDMKNALLSDDPSKGVMDSVVDAMSLLADPYLSPSFGAKTLSEIIIGQDEFGREIYSEDNLFVEKIAKSVAHLGVNTVTNSFQRDTANVIKSVFTEADYIEHSGQEVSVGDYLMSFAGAKPIQFDAVKGLQQKTWEATREYRKAQKEFSSSVFSFSSLSSSEIRSRVNEVSRSHNEYYQTLVEKVQAARYFGLSEDDIAKALSSAGISGYKESAKKPEDRISGRIKLLLDGKIPAYSFPAKSADNALKKFEGRNIKEGAMQNLLNNISLAQQVVNGEES